MCGIAGRSSFVALESGRISRLAQQLGAQLRRRGPDGGNFVEDAEILLVHRRLSIIDLSPAGSQPLWNEDRTVCVIANGEIYNFVELRDRLEKQGHRFRSGSDSEVIVHLYEEGGIAHCCEALRGMFAFAVWDARSRDLFLVRDRMGIKPLILAEHGEGVTFASTLEALLADPAVPRDVRAEALLSVLQVGFVPAPWSVLACARHVGRGSWVHVRAGRVVEERQWWRDAPEVTSPNGELDVRDAFASAVRSHLVADVPVGLLLSGGIDSGLVAAMSVAAGASPCAWSVSHPGHDEDEFFEATEVARHLALDLREIRIGTALSEEDFDQVVRAANEPIADTSLIGLHRIFRTLSEERRVVLSGDGGDELFGGYDWHTGMPATPRWAQNRGFRAISGSLAMLSAAPGRVGTLGSVAALVRRHPASIYLDKLRITSQNELHAAGIESIVIEPLESTAISAWDAYSAGEELERMLAVDRATALVDQMLAKVDSASMWYGVEVRVPFLGEEVVRAAKTVPADRKRRGSTGKVCLREWYAALGPPHLASRRKTGFNSPLGAWLSAPVGAALQERAAVGLEALGSRTRAGAPRLVFAAAVIGTWLERLRRATAVAA